MAPFYAAKPDNALKRAEELLAQGQDAIALQTLNEAILSKRARTNPLNVMEPMMLKYIELCVNQRQGRMMKEGLHQYRNFAQNTSVNSIEIIVNKLVELSEQKVAEARAKADQIAVEVIDDLEASETPESIMLSTVSGEQSKDRTDRAVVTPWLKFLWEVYRTVLDLLRNNARLETLYHTVTKNAFTFCLTYARKTEFRRLCEILRNHFQNVSKYSHQPHSINLNDPDTLQQYLEVRFNQLNAAAELELWQEAFKSVEDIYTLLTTSKRPPKPVMMANYYDKLTKIFMVSEDYLFHSAAWNRYSNIERAINKNLTEEEQSRMASVVLLSALAIPIITTTKTRPGYVEADEHRIQKLNRLSMLMGLTQHPTRTGLLKEALNKNILARVRPEIRDLYNILEVQFHPLSICKKINPIMAKLSEDADMAKYVRPLHQVILTRLLQQLSQVYTTVKLDFVLKLASFPAPFNYDAATIEKFIMNGCKRGELSIRIDHASQSLIFETDLFAAPKGTITEGNQLQSSPSELMRTQLSRLGISLHAVVQMIDPSVKETAAKAKQEVVSRAIEGAEKEHKAALARKSTIEQRKEIIETELARLEKQAAQEKAIAAQKKAEAEKKRMEEEQRRREEERTKRVKEEIQRDQAKRIAEEITAKTGLELKPEQIEQSDVQSLLDLKVSRMQSEQREMSERLKQIGKRLDHTERAFRKEEIPLLEKDYERQQKADKAYFEAARKAEATAARDAHEQGMVLKKRFARLLGDYNEYKQQYDSKRQQAVDAARRQAEEAIEKEKQERIAEWRIARDELIKAQETAEAERKRREEEEQRIREEEEREAAEKAERLAREKEESAEQERKLAEQARKQAEREREIERKQAERAAQPAAPRSEAYVSPSQKGGAYVPPAQRSGGAYVPPNLRDRSAAAPESSWRNAAPGGAGARGDDKWRRSGAGPGAGAGSGFGSSFGDRRDDRERDRPPMARKAPGAGAGSAPGSGSVNRRW
ncbi:eukaryotic translation initiation factor 3 subunit A [Apophysomyces sp. BC1021]|nr:eukaryotic translation initiation factor 3 subunit A [Apophysomyces sp. BC1021]